jgi:hypothetical protein
MRSTIALLKLLEERSELIGKKPGNIVDSLITKAKIEVEDMEKKLKAADLKMVYIVEKCNHNIPTTGWGDEAACAIDGVVQEIQQVAQNYLNVYKR